MRRGSEAAIEPNDLKILNAAVDPWLPMLYLVSRVAPLNASQISELNCADLLPHGEGISWRDQQFLFPGSTRGIARAFREAFTEGRGESDPLFETRTKRRMPSSQVRVRLESACRAFDLPRSPAMARSSTLKKFSAFESLRPLDPGAVRV